ncbi:MAG: UDP-N-acetylmuramate--L-alanine ligase [Blastocatellia bacterium]|nr:UDP-N-acetylmuramate--L-alanine ligase [Blastocatellia bacterium]MCS7157036.1 UDP-N-acetylmuramate--L-alanine ligase [Blastocatellia bacterium]MCX7752237.1 UDP-N-acetylmuramate--L-alanine ligase [Blastocatellia bacterium]MDW8167728.1 UDP-N-acetylmuramate--L-alanine ligase [Acidobacteriota bacterium]MDW8256328.1 UDP-N-acetylmuramate--L-alanine ligase [Acidobacteriota bacterium]
MLRRVRTIHLVGIGGAGMSGIAELLLNLGYRVSGSDLRPSPILERLQRLGARIVIGHRPENIGEADVVVFSTAVRPENPELVAARERQIPVIPRAEMLAELMRLKYSIAVAGSHGKTTTTSMIATVLAHAGWDPTIVVGGRLRAIDSHAKLGSGDFMVVEADESDRSFLKLSPTFAVITNIDREHLDHYADLAELREAFVEFANRVPFYGSVIVCLDDENVQAILPHITRKVITYGLSAQCEISAIEIETPDCFHATFTVRRKGEAMGRIRLSVSGHHNVCNALAACAVGLDLEIPFETIAAALEDFRGVDRRFQVKGEAAGVLIVDDYGHHPTEIKATLTTARLCGRRVVVLFQPHRYTRTHLLLDDFARAFYEADVVLVTDIYAASEEPIEGVTAERLVERLREFGHRNAQYVGDLDAAIEATLAVLRPGDLLLTLGAGSVTQAADRILTVLHDVSERTSETTHKGG